MQAGDFIKVGITKNSVIHRAKQIQTGCPIPISEIEFIEFSTKAEALLAEKLVHTEHAFYNSHGEWFVKFDKYISNICKTIGVKTSDLKSAKYKSNIDPHIKSIISGKKTLRKKKCRICRS